MTTPAPDDVVWTKNQPTSLDHDAAHVLRAARIWHRYPNNRGAIQVLHRAVAAYVGQDTTTSPTGATLPAEQVPAAHTDVPEPEKTTQAVCKCPDGPNGHHETSKITDSGESADGIGSPHRARGAYPADLALLEQAWGIIANAGQGDWYTQTTDWVEAAQRWRDRYHARIGQGMPALAWAWADTFRIPGHIDITVDTTDAALRRLLDGRSEHDVVSVETLRQLLARPVEVVDHSNGTERPEDAVRRYAGEVWRLGSGLADLGIVLSPGPVDEAPVTTALDELRHLQAAVELAREARRSVAKMAEADLATAQSALDAANANVQARDEWATEVARFHHIPAGDDLYAEIACKLTDAIHDATQLGRANQAGRQAYDAVTARLRTADAELAEVRRQRDKAETIASARGQALDRRDAEMTRLAHLAKTRAERPRVWWPGDEQPEGVTRLITGTNREEMRLDPDDCWRPANGPVNGTAEGLSWDTLMSEEGPLVEAGIIRSQPRAMGTVRIEMAPELHELLDRLRKVEQADSRPRFPVEPVLVDQPEPPTVDRDYPISCDS